MTTNLPLELPFPDEGLDQPEFKSSLMTLMQHGFDAALQQNNEEMDKKIQALHDKVDNLAKRIVEEDTRFMVHQRECQIAAGNASPKGKDDLRVGEIQDALSLISMG